MEELDNLTLLRKMAPAWILGENVDDAEPIWKELQLRYKNGNIKYKIHTPWHSSLPEEVIRFNLELLHNEVFRRRKKNVLGVSNNKKDNVLVRMENDIRDYTSEIRYSQLSIKEFTKNKTKLLKKQSKKTNAKIAQLDKYIATENEKIKISKKKINVALELIGFAKKNIQYVKQMNNYNQERLSTEVRNRWVFIKNLSESEEYKLHLLEYEYNKRYGYSAILKMDKDIMSEGKIWKEYCKDIDDTKIIVLHMIRFQLLSYRRTKK